jgi:guanine deaminase
MEEIKKTFLRRAIALAADGVTRNQGGPFGAVIAQNGKVIAEGVNAVTSGLDPTAHAEIVAIRNACRSLNRFELADCELYASCEPCPMCLAAIYWARIKIVYFAGTRQDAARAGFDDEFLYDELKKNPADRRLPIIQMLSDEAGSVFESWIRKPDKIPY